MASIPAIAIFHLSIQPPLATISRPFAVGCQGDRCRVAKTRPRKNTSGDARHALSE